MKRLVCVLAVMATLYGCASTSINSYKDPQYGNKAYGCIIVAALEKNLEYRKMVENALLERFKEVGVRSIMSLDVLPPTRSFSKPEMDAAMKGANCESLLIVSPSGGARNVTYVRNGDGGITPIISSNITAEISLIDIGQDQKVWIANTNSAHLTIIPVGDGIESMVNDAAKELVGKLIEDKMLKLKQ